MNGDLSEPDPFPAFLLGTATEARSVGGTPSAMQVAWRMWALRVEKPDADTSQQHPPHVTSELCVNKNREKYEKKDR